MPLTDPRQIAKSAIETALAIINKTGEIAEDRAVRLVLGLEADLAALEDLEAAPLLEIDGVPVANGDLVTVYMERANFHAARIKSPGQFQRFRQVKNKFGSGVDAVFGFKGAGRGAGEGSGEVQAILFDASKFTPAQASAWIKAHPEHKMIKFEKATGGEETKEAGVEVSEVIRKQGNAIVLFDSAGNKVLQRFEFGAGKDHEDEKAARAAAHKREGQIKFFKKQREAYLEELGGSLTDMDRMITDAFHAKFSPADRFEGPYRTRDTFAGHPVMGNSLVIHDRTEGKLLAVPYTTGDGGIDFAARDEWREVVATYQFVDVEAEAAECGISESADFTACAVEIIREDGAHVLPELGARSPVIIKAQAIEPGFGNSRDMNYYGAEMLRRHAHVFNGVDIFVTNHKVGEKTDPHKIGRFREVVGFSETGAPISEVVIYDPAYAEKTRARAAADQLDTMEFSIHAGGKARKGVVDGTKCNVVEAITAVQSIDLVGKAGAGGRALGLAESAGGNMDKEKQDIEEQGEGAQNIININEQGEPEPKEAPAEQPQSEPEPKAVPAERVKEMLAEANVSARFHKWIERGAYADEAAVTAAIAEAQKDAAELTAAGRPFGLGPVDHTKLTEGRAELAATYEEIEKRHGIVPLAG